MVFTQASAGSIPRGSASSFRVHLAAKMTVSDTVHVGSSPAPGASSHSGIVQWLGQRLLMPPIGVRVPVPEPCTVTRRGRGSPVSGVRRVRVPYSAPCPVLLAARQSDSQSGNIGSIPVRDATFWKAKWQWCHTGFEYRRSARVGVRLLRLPPLHLEDEPIKDRACLLNSADAKASGEHALRLPPIRGVAYRSGATFGT